MVTFHVDAEEEHDVLEGLVAAPDVDEGEEEAVGDPVDIDETGEGDHPPEQVAQQQQIVSHFSQSKQVPFGDHECPVGEVGLKHKADTDVPLVQQGSEGPPQLTTRNRHSVGVEDVVDGEVVEAEHYRQQSAAGEVGLSDEGTAAVPLGELCDWVLHL